MTTQSLGHSHACLFTLTWFVLLWPVCLSVGRSMCLCVFRTTAARINKNNCSSNFHHHWDDGHYNGSMANTVMISASTVDGPRFSFVELYSNSSSSSSKNQFCNPTVVVYPRAIDRVNVCSNLSRNIYICGREVRHGWLNVARHQQRQKTGLPASAIAVVRPKRAGGLPMSHHTVDRNNEKGHPHGHRVTHTYRQKTPGPGNLARRAAHSLLA